MIDFSTMTHENIMKMTVEERLAAMLIIADYIEQLRKLSINIELNINECIKLKGKILETLS